MTITVEELIAQLKQYDPKAKLYYQTSSNHAIGVAEVKTFERVQEDSPNGVAFYLIVNCIKNGRESYEII